MRAELQPMSLFKIFLDIYCLIDTFHNDEEGFPITDRVCFLLTLSKHGCLTLNLHSRTRD